jgi:hypothetical protein
MTAALRSMTPSGKLEGRVCAIYGLSGFKNTRSKPVIDQRQHRGQRSHKIFSKIHRNEYLLFSKTFLQPTIIMFEPSFLLFG